MSKHQVPRYTPLRTIILLKPFLKPTNRSFKDLPLNSTNQPPSAPRLPPFPTPALNPPQDFRIQILHNLRTPPHPLLPILPHKRPLLTLTLQQVNAIMQLTHSFRNLLTRTLDTQIRSRERRRIEELLEAAIRERAQQARADLLARQAAQDAELVLAVDEVLDLRPVDAQEEFGGRFVGVPGRVGGDCEGW